MRLDSYCATESPQPRWLKMSEYVLTGQLEQYIRMYTDFDTVLHTHSKRHSDISSAPLRGTKISPLTGYAENRGSTQSQREAAIRIWKCPPRSASLQTVTPRGVDAGRTSITVRARRKRHLKTRPTPGIALYTCNASRPRVTRKCHNHVNDASTPTGSKIGRLHPSCVQ